MVLRLFTIVSEFRGTTDVRQVRACDEREAVLAWLETFGERRPFSRASTHLARSIEADLANFPPVPFQGLVNIWCLTASCGGDVMLANIVETGLIPGHNSGT